MLLAATADRSKFVDLDVAAGAWMALLLVIVGLLAIDLFRHRDAHAPSPREALVESTVEYGGWSIPFFDPDTMGAAIGDAMVSAEAPLFGRRTWQAMAAAWPE